MDRFNLIVQEFLGSTQFLIITHNKLTMTYAKTIFGVTQEEAGVSKKISIRIEEVDRHLEVAD